MRHAVDTSTIEFTSGDGADLSGDVAAPAAAHAAAIICHPHPKYGGNRFNPVVGALFDALPAAGVAALRFDFRPMFDNGRGESIDARAAINVLSAALPDLPIIAAGYSFGAAVVVGLDDARIAAKVLVAPPLAMMAVAPGMDVPTLVLTPAHDQFSPPGATAPIVAGWPDTEHQIIESADHFLADHTSDVATRVLAWLAAENFGEG